MMIRICMVILIAIRLAATLTIHNESMCGPINYCDHDATCSFSSFVQLNCSKCSDLDKNYFADAYYLTLYPDDQVILDNSLNMSKILDLVFTSADDRGVMFYDLQGLDLNIIDMWKPRYLSLYAFERFKFDFYYNGQPFDLSCNNPYWQLNISTMTNIFTYFPSIEIKIANSKFPPEVCPLVFNNADLNILSIYSGALYFDTNSYPFLDQITNHVFKYSIRYMYKFDITNKSLHSSVFRGLTVFEVESCSIQRIQTDVFRGLNELKNVYLMLINLRSFFHLNGIDWMYYLNVNYQTSNFYLANSPDALRRVLFLSVELWIQIHLNDHDLYPVEFFPYFEYRFPDEDFCLFASFPHENLIVPKLVNSYGSLNCSCTMKWIMKYIPFYEQAGMFIKESDIGYSLCNNVTEASCNLESRLNSCSISPQIDDYQPHYFDIYSLKNIIMSLQTVIRDIFGPVFSALAITANLFTILTIQFSPKKRQSNKSVTLNDNLLYRYMKWNAGLNLISALTFFFFYTIKCKLHSRNNLGFVPDLCFQEEVYINIISNCLKLMANFSFLQMCLNRFVLVGKDHNKRIVSLSQCSPRKFFFITFLFSSLLSVIIYFKEQTFGSQTPKEGIVIDEEYYYHDYYWYWVNTTIQQAYKKIVTDKLDHLPVISAFMFVNDFFSYFFYCIASTLVDTITVYNLRLVLNEKKKKSSMDHQKESTRAEIKSIIMIVLSSLFNFLLRFPELFSTVFFYTLLFDKESYYTFKMLCFSYRECLPIVEITNVFFLLSLSLNFIFYVTFDKNFKEAFLYLFDKHIRRKNITFLIV